MVEEIVTKKIETEKSSGRLVVVLVRGLVGVTTSVKETLKFLRLTRKNNCVTIKNNSKSLGMLKKVKDYVTWGIISEETFQELIKERGEEFKGRKQDSKQKYSYKTLEYQSKHYKPYFRLNPPRKGFGRKGIKVSFKVGGALGNREEKMNDLIKRMI